jgi:hypothetical protein
LIHVGLVQPARLILPCAMCRWRVRPSCHVRDGIAKGRRLTAGQRGERAPRSSPARFDAKDDDSTRIERKPRPARYVRTSIIRGFASNVVAGQNELNHGRVVGPGALWPGGARSEGRLRYRTEARANPLPSRASPCRDAYPESRPSGGRAARGHSRRGIPYSFHYG